MAPGDSRDSQQNRRSDGGRRSDRDSNHNRRQDSTQSRDERGSRNSDRRDDRRGGYQGNRGNDGERRGGYQGNRSEGGERRSFGGDRRDDRRGGYQGNRSNDGERRDDRRGGYQGNRNNDGERRGGYQGNRSEGGERRSFGGDRRDDRRGGYQGNRRDDRGGSRRRDDGGGDRGGFGRNNNDRRATRSTDTGEYAREQRARRPRIQEPPIPEEVTGKELDKELLGQLRSLDKENAAMVAKHLVSAGGFLDVDPERAYEHAKAAMARAGRVGLVREALGIAAYHVEKYDEAVRELRTHRRISGSNENIALIADAERGREKPQKAIELFESAAELELDNDARTELVIVAAGAKSDLGDLKGARALIEAEDFTQKPSGGLVRLMAAYSDVLRLHGETEMADKYEELSRRTAKATGTLFGDEEPDPNLGVEIETVEEIPDEELIEPGDKAAVDATPESDAAAEGQSADESAAKAADAEAVDASTDSPAADESAADDAEAVQVPAKSKTHVSEKELKKVKVSEEEIEAELDELLEDAEAGDASSAETSEAPEESDTSLNAADNADPEEPGVSYRLSGNQ
ncbi:hypothetical protein [Brevibacterium sp. FME17]|uniref:hypothetical protein n=1 Tax=Brevibacterium sp. FME17 TaxID=2742606 RepID=UPI001D01AFFB|nr:hypothetical protein [Brevibacterium sp. FME17]